MTKISYAYVADGESTTGHVFNGQLVVTSLVDVSIVNNSESKASSHLLSEIGNSLLNSNQVHTLCVAHNRGNETLLGSNSDANVDVVTVNDSVTTVRSFNGSIDGRQILHSKNASARECGHETELDASLLQDVILVQLAEFHERRHVDFVECGKGSSGVLGLLETLGNTESHTVHFDLDKLAMRHITWLVFTYTSLFTASSLGRCRRGFLLGLCGFGLGFLGLLFLDGLGFRRCWFLGFWLGRGGLGLFFLLFWGRLILGLLSSFAAGAGLEFYDGLADSNGVFFADEEFLDGTGFGGVDSDVDLNSIRYRLAGNLSEEDIPCRFRLSQFPHRVPRNRQPLHLIRLRH